VITETEVDGVPTLLAPTSGPMHAGLTFRVGRADETLASAGITHLVEHLALFRHGLSDYHYNGATGTVVTHFHMQGSEDDVVAFLTGVCDSLLELPFDRLETEKSILRTESANRTPAVNEPMPLWRHGARDFGLVSYDELGLPRLRPEDLQAWAMTWFTRQNAVLWIAAEGVPPGLRLRLPDGHRRPVPAASSALPSSPAYFGGNANGVVYDAVVRRRVAGSVYAGVLERELFRNLRQEGGFSYTTTTDYSPRGDAYAVVTALADALADKQDAVLGGFVDVLAKLRYGRVEQADLDSVRAKAHEALRHPDRDAARLPAAALNLLTGHPNRDVDDIMDELRAVTVDDVHDVAVEAAGTGLLMVPRGCGADWAGYTAAPTQSAAAVQGQRYRSRQNDGADLVIGTDGVSLVEVGCVSTVRFAECVIGMSWPDGARQLVGADGIGVRVEPTLFHLDGSAIAAIDAGVPPASLVLMPARDPDAIPQPEVPPPPAPAPRSGGRIAAFVVLIVFASIAGCAAGLFSLVVATADPVANPDDAILRDPVSYTMLGCFWLSVVALIAGAVLVWRRRRPDA
jgi:hypothetical protein